jgi:hypothetical protein
MVSVAATQDKWVKNLLFSELEREKLYLSLASMTLSRSSFVNKEAI